MPRRQPIPRLWLLTDERQGDALWTALQRLPRGGGVIFRHYGLAPTARRALFDAVRRVVRRRRLRLVLAGSPRQAAAWRADGAHGRSGWRASLRAPFKTAPAHSRCDRIAAERAGADAILLSPSFPTRSHPGAPALGRLRFGLAARGARAPIIALGGITAARARSLKNLAYGWAAIDAWGVAKD